MPVRIPKHKVKISCKNCNWHLVICRGGIGCVLSPPEMRNILLNTSLDSCPKCGNRELFESDPSTIEKINPLESIKRVFYYTNINKIKGEKSPNKK